MDAVALQARSWRRRFFQITCTLLLASYHGAEAARVVRFALNGNMPSRVAVEIIHQTSSWCVARQGSSDPDLQTALDWACGALNGQGNVDCSTITEGGSCYSPNTLYFHSSYAFNAYFQKQFQAPGSCSFGNLAQITNIDPSSGGCTFPSSNSILNANITTSNPTTFGSTGTNTNSNGTGPSVSWHAFSTLMCAFLVLVMSFRL